MSIGLIIYSLPPSPCRPPPWVRLLLSTYSSILLLLWFHHHHLSPWWMFSTGPSPAPSELSGLLSIEQLDLPFWKANLIFPTSGFRAIQHHCFQEKEPNTWHNPAQSASTSFFHHLVYSVSPTFLGLPSVLPQHQPLWFIGDFTHLSFLFFTTLSSALPWQTNVYSIFRLKKVLFWGDPSWLSS